MMHVVHYQLFTTKLFNHSETEEGSRFVFFTLLQLLGSYPIQPLHVQGIKRLSHIIFILLTVFVS